MNDFVRKVLGRKKVEIIRDCCDNPINVSVKLNWNDTTIHFKIGVLIKGNIIYSEEASDHCWTFGEPTGYVFTVEGKEYDFTNVSEKDCTQKWCEIIDNFNNPGCQLQEDDDFIV